MRGWGMEDGGMGDAGERPRRGRESGRAGMLPGDPAVPFQVRLAIAEKALKCEEHDVNLPLSEHNEPWFMRLSSSGEVPVLIHGENIICEATQIIDYLEATFVDGKPTGISVCGSSPRPVACSNAGGSSVSLQDSSFRAGRVYSLTSKRALLIVSSTGLKHVPLK